MVRSPLPSCQWSHLGSVVEDERDERHHRRDRCRPVGRVEGGEHRAEAVEGRLGEGGLTV